MGYRCIQLKGIKGTQMTPYGANTTITGGYHNYSISENGSRKYSDYVEYIGENYLKHAYIGTQGAEEEINYVTVYEDGYFTIQDSVTLPYNDGSGGSKPWKSFIGIRILYQGEILVASTSNIASSNNQITTDKISFCFVIDDDNDLGQILSFKQGPSDGDYSWTIQTMGLKKDWGKIYNILIGRILVGATIKVNYYLPNDEYTYAKITYKQNTSPIDQNDGDSVDIDPSLSSVNIEGFEENETYWFTIFTNKSESEAFPYTVEVDPVPHEYKTYIDNINGNGFDWIKNLQSEEVSATFTDHITLTGLNMNFSPGSRTWYTYSHIGTDIEYWNKTNFSYVTSALFVSTTGIDSVNITGSDDSYTCTINKNNSDVEIYNNNGMFVYDKNMSMGVASTNGIPRKWFANFNFNQNYLYYGNCNPFYNGSWATRTFTGTLTQVFENLQRYARNIDIYVNNELWSKAGK